MDHPYCKQFTGGRVCQRIRIHVSRNYCQLVCKGEPTEEIMQEKVQRLVMSPKIEPWRIWCQTCPGPSGKHLDDKDTYLKPCGFCLLLGIRTDGSRQPLADWWASGGACPLGHWPTVEKR